VPKPPKPRRLFTPPPQVKPAEIKLPDAPAAAAAVKVAALKLDQPKAPPKTFQTPPEVKRSAAVAAALPAPPTLANVPPRVGALRVPKGFTPPPEKKQAAAAPALPAAPSLANAAPRFDAPRIPKGFTPPPDKKRAAAPTVEVAAAAPPETVLPPDVKPSLAIVGLKPVDAPEIPTPPGSHEAGFSAAPRLRPEGSDTDTKEAAMKTPGLLTRGGTKEAQNTLIASLASSTSTQGLIDGMRRARSEQGQNPDAAMPALNAPRVSTAPDPRLDGRAVYVVAIQMPNITSYSGSWLVWFAEREGAEHHISMTAPVPTRKSDPGYVAAAREERIEGKVRLFAVIRKTGKVDSVELLQHLDTRLDQSAEAALLKWEFEPAKADGVPVDVEAVFEIPFHLAPRTAR
jgi:TonB family protein